MEDQRRWEDMKMDCLVKVFEKVGMESLLLDVPFVCKSWHRASLSPSCWKHLIFPDFEPEPFELEPYPIFERVLCEYRVDMNCFNVTSFIKFVVNRSCGKAVSLKLPGCSTVEAFEYVADVCPGLVTLGLPRLLLFDNLNLELIGKWKELAILSLGCSNKLEKILALVSLHCKFFSHLILANNNISKDEALAIANLVPNIKCLSLNRARIDRDNLIILLKGCKDLVFLDARNCIGFKEGDVEISQLASNISIFKCEGSEERFEFELFGDFKIDFDPAIFAELDVDDDEVEVDDDEEEVGVDEGRAGC